MENGLGAHRADDKCGSFGIADVLVEKGVAAGLLAASVVRCDVTAPWLLIDATGRVTQRHAEVQSLGGINEHAVGGQVMTYKMTPKVLTFHRAFVFSRAAIAEAMCRLQKHAKLGFQVPHDKPLQQ